MWGDSSVRKHFFTRTIMSKCTHTHLSQCVNESNNVLFWQDLWHHLQSHTQRKSIPFYTIFYDNGTSNEYALVIWIWNLLVLYTWTDCYNPKMKIKPVKYWLPYVLLILEFIDLNKPLSLHNTFGAQLWTWHLKQWVCWAEVWHSWLLKFVCWMIKWAK